MVTDRTRHAAELRAASDGVLADWRARRRTRPGRPQPIQRGLVEDLAAVGVFVENVWDLVDGAEPYPHAVPALVSWLQRVDEFPVGEMRERFREGLIRALTVKEARPAAAPQLLRQFRMVEDPAVRWAAGNALAEMADHSVFGEIADLVLDRGFGPARQMIVYSLGRIGGRRYRSRVIDLLVDLLDDDDVVLHALHGIRVLRITSAVETGPSHRPSKSGRRADRSEGAHQGQIVAGIRSIRPVRDRRGGAIRGRVRRGPFH